MARLRWVACFLFVCPVVVLAQGRKPEPDTDNFPDYNRLEMHPRTKPAPDAQPPVSSTAAVGSPAAPVMMPALNPPLNTPVDDDVPKAPPKAVPMPDGASEPPLPDDMRDTLIPSTTAQ